MLNTIPSVKIQYNKALSYILKKKNNLNINTNYKSSL
jgi:hypothetical protein